MAGTGSCTCIFYDADGVGVRSQTSVSWSGEGALEAIGVPRTLSPGKDVTVPGLVLPPRSPRLRVEYNIPKSVTVVSHGAEGDGVHCVEADNPGRVSRSVPVTFSVGADVDMPHRRAYPFALNVWRVVEADWFARLRAGVMAGASVLGVLLLLDAVWGTVGEAVSSVGLSTGGSVGLGLTALALAGLASRQAWHTLVRRAVLSMPTKTTFVGRLEHPALAVTLTPPIRDIAPAAQEAVEDYCARLSERLRHVRILDMGQPLDLEGTYIPARLVRVHGPESEVADPDAELDAADDPRHRDQIVDAQSTARHTPDDVLRRSRRVVVTGDVGAGKTTMLRHLAVQMSSPNSVGLPLYIELFEFRPPSEDEDPFVHLLRSLAEPLLSEEADDSVDAVAAYAAERLADGSAAILWDGLDEISGPTDEETQDRLEGVLRVMEAMAERFPSALMVATCRRATPERFSRLEGAFAIWQTTGFDSEDVHRFVESWFTQTPELGEQLLAELDRFPSLLTLISTPLLLALICLVFQRRGGLPQRRADLYRRCADLLLVEWDSSRGRDRHPQFLPEHKEELLRRVAWQLHLSGSQDVAADDLLSSLGDLLPEIGLVGETGEEIVSELVTHHGLLRDSAPGRYRFQHFALQEFFASESIERRVPLSAVIQQRHRPWWQEVLRLFAGRDDCTQVVRALLLEPEDLFRTNLLLAGECLAEGSGIDPFLRMLVVDELILLLQVGTYHRHREQAAFRLARLSDPNIAGKLLEMAGDKSLDELTRCGIAEALRTSRVAGVSPTIADLVLVEDLEASVRVRLVHALGDLGDATVATGLERLVDGESVPPSVRAAAAGALATLGTQDAATMLTRILLAQGVPGSVRGAVAGALRTLGPTGLMDEVLAALSDWHVDATLRAEIAHALGRLDPEGWADKLVELLADERLTPSVRIGLASALVQWGPTVHTPRLTELVAEESVDYAVRVVLAETLISISDERVRDRLEAIAASGQVDAPLRMRLLVALGGLAYEDAADEMLEIVADQKARPYLRRHAADGLKGIGNRHTIDRALELFRSGGTDSIGLELAASLLGALGDSSVQTDLQKGLENSQLPLSVRMEAGAALTTVGGDGATSVILDILGDSQLPLEVRSSVCQTLRKVVDLPNQQELLYSITKELATSDVADALYLVSEHLAERLGKTIWPDEIGLPTPLYPWAEDGATDSE